MFVIISTDATGDGGGPIVAFGQIHGTGHDTVLGPRRDRFEFPDGNVVIRHRAKGTPVEQFDPVACYFKFVEVGRWQVIRGTGAYAGATGGGRYRVEGAGIGEKNAQGECAENQPPRAFYSKVRAVGDLSY